jgi:Protein of unknown function (DUF3300)
VKNPQARIFVPLLVAAALLSGSMVSAQESGAPAAQQTAPAQKTFSQAELDQILAPVALYPDNLLAQILMASTYPLEIIMAARWSSANPGVSGKALEDAMAKQPWDPAVKSLTAVPQVLQHMNDNLEWMQKLGDAALAQREDVMKTVQALRAKAATNGNLKTTPEQVVKTEVVESNTVYVIESSKPDVVYVPAYDPTVVYGYWGYPAYPPYYMYPPGYVYAPGLAFATGIFVGAAIWGNCNWGGNNWNVNVNHYNSFNRSNISNGNWNHNVDHRRGVAYKDQGVANKYGRGNQGAQTRDSYRGRDQGGSIGGGGRNGGPSASTRDIGGGSRGGGPSASTRDVGSGSRGGGSGAASRGGGRSDGGFGGMSSGSGTRAASSRGGGSYGGRSGGGRGGGGGRRR